MNRLRVAVLVSGRGSNLESLLRASREGRMRADVVLALSNKPDAAALEVAARFGVPRLVVPSAGLGREEHERRVGDALAEARPDLVLLAGYMRILTPGFIRRFEGRLLNVHPSLLPAFPGVDAQGQAHAAGVRIAGCTVHFVTEQVDAGPVLAQAAVALPPGCTADEARARILEAEHKLYPRAVDLLATGQAWWDAGAVRYHPDIKSPGGVLHSP